MRNYGSDKTYRGFVNIYEKEKIVDVKDGQDCSQIIWEASKKNTYKVDKIRFYFPNDYLLPLSRNKPFLTYWTKIAAEWFSSKISYIGKFSSAEIDFSIKTANQNAGYKYIYDNGKQVIEPTSYLQNKGDLIITDLFRGFEIEIPLANIGSKSMLEYSCYCFIRYLFCSHYHPLVLDFLVLLKGKQMYGCNGEEDFTLFQIAHYNSPYYGGYSGFYGFVRDLNILTGPAYQLTPLNTFKSRLKSNTLNDSISLNASQTGVTYKEIQQLLKLGKIKEIYGKLK